MLKVCAYCLEEDERCTIDDEDGELICPECADFFATEEVSREYFEAEAAQYDEEE